MLPVIKGISTLNRHKNKGFFFAGVMMVKEMGLRIWGQRAFLISLGSWSLLAADLASMRWSALSPCLILSPSVTSWVCKECEPPSKLSLGLDIWQILLKTYGTPGFLGHAGEMALNPIHKGCGHVFFFLIFFGNENDFTVYDNKQNTYYTENSNTAKKYKEGKKWLLFFGILDTCEVRARTSRDCWEGSMREHRVGPQKQGWIHSKANRA